jgi:hypothetical protein
VIHVHEKAFFWFEGIQKEYVYDNNALLEVSKNGEGYYKRISILSRRKKHNSTSLLLNSS